MHLGAAQGLTAWMAYGVVEYFLITIVEGIYHQRHILPSSHWNLTLLLFVIYAGIGLLVGSAAGLAVHLASQKVSWLRNADAGILRYLTVLMSLVMLSAQILPTISPAAA
jgi:hypothetical protein